MDEELVDYALQYAARGWKVLPLHTVVNDRCSCQKVDCASPGKHPLINNGVHGATTDADTIRQWWERWPWANIGIATGTISGIAVVDIDPRNGGMDSLASLNLPATLMAQTGGKGYHYYYKTSGPTPKGRITQGVDLQADGGYVVAPPSMHLLGEYKWIARLPMVDLPKFTSNGHAQKPLTPDPAPTMPPTSQTGGTSGTVIIPDGKEWVVALLAAPCPQGQRNETLTRLAGYFRNLLPEPVVVRLLLDWNAARCLPPLPDSEVRQNVRHKYRRYSGMATDAPTGRLYWTMRELLTTDFPKPLAIVEDIVVVGLTVLAGRPKRGKSMMALGMAGDVANGTPCLGKKVDQGLVVYIALEDSEIRIKERAVRMGIPETDNILVRTTYPPLDQGGIAETADLLEHYQPKMVIIDTLGRSISGKLDQDSVGEMTDILGAMQRMAHYYKCAILMVDHHKKGGIDGNDVIDDVLGSTGKTAVADSILGLYRRTNESFGTLSITGRDIEEQVLDIVWDGIHLRWKIADSPAEKIMDQRLDRLVAYLQKVEETDTRTAANYLNVAYNTAADALREGVARGFFVEQFINTANRGAPKIIYRLKS